jgi:hypothetical protein
MALISRVLISSLPNLTFCVSVRAVDLADPDRARGLRALRRLDRVEARLADVRDLADRAVEHDALDQLVHDLDRCEEPAGRVVSDRHRLPLGVLLVGQRDQLGLVLVVRLFGPLRRSFS